MGEWEPLDEGRVLIGANSTYTVESTGGSASTSHTHSVTASGTIGGTALTVNQLPSHNHTATIGGGSTPYLSTVTTGGANPSDYSTSNVTVPKNGTTGWLRSGEESGGYYDQVLKFTNSSTSHSHTISIGSTGSGQTHTHTFTGTATTSASTTINNMQPYLAVYM